MSNALRNLSTGGLGKRQQRAAALRAELEAKKRTSPERPEDVPVKAADDEESSESVDQPADDRDLAVGQGDHVVKPGECFSSIARKAGHFWERLWNHPDNAEVRQVRQDPHMLLPGDRVTVPEIEQKHEPGETEMRHRFVRRGEPGMLRLVVKDGDEPRANEPYVLTFEDREVSGVTDAMGQLEQPIPPDARSATLIVGEDANAEEYELNLGHLHPLETVSGVQARLDNIGYDVGTIDGRMNDKTIDAIFAFCVKHEVELPPKGQISEAFRSKLREEHGF